MKKVYLLKVVQHNITSYTGSLDARELVKLSKNIEVSTVQEAQRPLSGNKVKEIAQHVNSGEDGLIPGSIIIATTTPVVTVHPDHSTGIPNLYYMDFPETDHEFEQFKDSIEVMDGQHRLFSFREEYLCLDNAVRYDMPFNMYIMPTLRQRRMIFKIANEKQDKVNANLLMWFREMLGMFSAKERKYHPLVKMLNEENNSLLKSRIIMGAEKIKYGIKGSQLVKIFDKAKLDSLVFRGAPLSDDQRFTLICEYLKGWQRATGCDFSTQERRFGPLTKISGLRYIVLLIPAMYEKIIAEHKEIDETVFSEIIAKLYVTMGTTPKDFFDEDSLYNTDNPESLYAFRGEGATVSLSESHAAILKNMDITLEDDYNPFA